MQQTLTREGFVTVVAAVSLYKGQHRRPTVSMRKPIQQCTHKPQNLTETGMTDECRFGCKVMTCTCGGQVVSHRAVYGCRIG